MRGKHNKLGEGERQVRLGQDRLAIKRKRAESIYVVLPAPIISAVKSFIFSDEKKSEESLMFNRSKYYNLRLPPLENDLKFGHSQ